MEKVYMWGVNYTEEQHKGRTANLVICTKLKDAKEFSKNKFGYITRIGESKTTFHSFFGEFEPSATEQIMIDIFK